MSMAQNSPECGWIYQCDDIVVEPRAHRLERAGVGLSVEPKAYTVLVVLLEQAGEVVRKDTLLDAAWGHRHVTPGVLTRAISQLRRVLGDHAGHPRYIATVHSLGYRFIGEVHRTPVAVAPDAEIILSPDESGASYGPQPHVWRPRLMPTRWLAAAITLVLIVAMLAAASVWHPPRDHLTSPHTLPRPAVVLMPFARTPYEHAWHVRHWPRNHRVATGYPGSGDDMPAQMHAAGYLVLRPEQAPAARQ
jgi:DNA-binding winged helix-turn-helix (wHTH) protein